MKTRSLQRSSLSRSSVTATYRKRPFIGYKRRLRFGREKFGGLVSSYVPGGVLYIYKLVFVEISFPDIAHFPHLRALPQTSP